MVGFRSSLIYKEIADYYKEHLVKALLVKLAHFDLMNISSSCARI